MMSVWNFAWRAYLALAAVVMAGAIYGIATRQPPRGLECPKPVAAQDYAAFVGFRGALWPYVIYIDVVQARVPPQDWVILKYDALKDACSWAA
jgi:hypothetical protein